MEFEYFEDDGTDNEEIINEEETICNKPFTNQICRKSIELLKRTIVGIERIEIFMRLLLESKENVAFL